MGRFDLIIGRSCHELRDKGAWGGNAPSVSTQESACTVVEFLHKKAFMGGTTAALLGVPTQESSDS
jgi:hypothetical protein